MARALLGHLNEVWDKASEWWPAKKPKVGVFTATFRGVLKKLEGQEVLLEFLAKDPRFASELSQLLLKNADQIGGPKKFELIKSALSYFKGSILPTEYVDPLARCDGEEVVLPIYRLLLARGDQAAAGALRDVALTKITANFESTSSLPWDAKLAKLRKRGKIQDWIENLAKRPEDQTEQ